MNRQPTAWQMPPVFILAPDALLGVHGLAARQVRRLIYSSERLNTRATHIQCCPREPQTFAADHRQDLANRVRNATASGSGNESLGLAIRCQTRDDGIVGPGRQYFPRIAAISRICRFCGRARPSFQAFTTDVAIPILAAK